jgi:hypothetical protein
LHTESTRIRRQRKFEDRVRHITFWRHTEPYAAGCIGLILCKLHTVQHHFHLLRSVHANTPVLLAVLREGVEEIVAILSHGPRWIVDPIVQDVQLPIHIRDVDVGKPTNRRGHPIPFLVLVHTICVVVIHLLWFHGRRRPVHRKVCIHGSVLRWGRHCFAPFGVFRSITFAKVNSSGGGGRLSDRARGGGGNGLGGCGCGC